MPVAKRSLAITDAYRRDLASLSRRVEIDARRSWHLDWANLDASYVPIHAALFMNVSTAQRDAVRLTAGYLGAYMTSELGERVAAPVLNTRAYVGRSFTGGDLNEALRGPLIKVKVANKEGQPDPMGTGFKAMLASVDVNVKHAARQSLQDAMEADDRIVGWRRAVKGTCDACSGAADGSTLPPGTPLEIHPNCECVSEAVVQVPPRLPDEVMPRAMDVIGQNPSIAEDTLDAYRLDAYKDINDFLRGVGPDVNSQLERLIERMDVMYAKVPKMTEPAKVYRGIAKPIEDIFPQLRDTDLVGKVVDEPAFSSTSASKEVAQSFLRGGGGTLEGPSLNGDLLEITVQPGVRGVMAGKTEALIERDVSYRITGVRTEFDPVKGEQRIIEILVYR